MFNINDKYDDCDGNLVLARDDDNSSTDIDDEGDDCDEERESDYIHSLRNIIHDDNNNVYCELIEQGRTSIETAVEKGLKQHFFTMMQKNVWLMNIR
jgi:hypothetical protein